MTRETIRSPDAPLLKQGGRHCQNGGRFQIRTMGDLKSVWVGGMHWNPHPGPIASVTADGAYDGEPVYRAVAERQPDPPVAVIIPPRATAVPSPDAGITPTQRDRHIQMIGDKGRLAWQKTVGYGRRSHAETTMFRYKAIIGSSLRARTLPAQKTEAKVGCSVLNRMTRLGMPVSQRVR